MPASTTRQDSLQFSRWQRAPTAGTESGDRPPPDRFSRYNVQVDAPAYDETTYEEANLANPDWTKEETDYLVDVYRECYGKWPVIIDRYSYLDGPERSMEDLKSRLYFIQKSILELDTKREHMDQSQYQLWQTLDQFNPAQETSRKKLAEGHLYRRQTEVDEESVLLSELQRIMLTQATTDSEREELRRRLDYPRANTNGYQYTTSQALTGLWQQLLAADRMKKNARLRPTGHTAYDGFPTATPTSARPRDPHAGLQDMSNVQARRGTRDSLPSAQQNALPVDLSKADMARFGVLQNQDKLPSGVTFASDKLSKPRIAKSTVQTDKITTVLQYAQVPELIPLPTPAVVDQFDAIMSKVHAILDLRKLKDKEEQEIKVREAEAAQ